MRIRPAAKYFCLYLLLSAFLCLDLSQAKTKTNLKIASDEWCPFVCANEGTSLSGYLVEMTSLAFQRKKIDVTPALMPLNRSILEAAQGRIDGVYAPPIDRRLKMSQPLFFSKACFYTLKTLQWSYQGLASLQSIKWAAIDDYGYDNGKMDALIAAEKGKKNSTTMSLGHGEKAGLQNFNMLKVGRVQAILEHESVMNHLMKLEKVSDSIRQAGCLETPLPLVIGFSPKNPSVGQYVKALNEGLKEISQSPVLAELKKKYEVISGE